MSLPSIALHRLPTPFVSTSQLPRARLLTARLYLTRRHLTPAFVFNHSLNQQSLMDKNQARGESTTGISEWKQRAPYRIHEPNEKFDVKYEANCHCGRVKYQLSRIEPLDSKLCHCTTCQTQHGMSPRSDPVTQPTNVS